MHMVGHHHIAHQQESILSPNSGELLDEHIPCPRCCEQGQPPVTTEGHKMKLTLPVVALQSLRHSTPKIPTLKHRGWGTLATLHPNEVQQWYPLFACRRQEKTKTSAWATRPVDTASISVYVRVTTAVSAATGAIGEAARTTTQRAATLLNSAPGGAPGAFKAAGDFVRGA